MNIAILGAAFGDEGKGRVVHHFSKNYDWVVRFGGGANAGHTIYKDGKKFVHNLVPSVDFIHFDTTTPRSPRRTKAFLGAGMVIDLDKLYDEIVSISQTSFYEFHVYQDEIVRRIYVDPDAFLVLPHHKEEDKANNAHIGSTNRGIGPAYRDKVARKGKRVKDYIKENHPSILKLKSLGVQFKHAFELKHEMEKASILYEGAQGVMLDINHGTYPYVSCGDSTVAGIYASGFAFAPPEKVYGVAKCYATKVGEGPFPTEIVGEEADSLRERGKEYGATTGRPRRVGWLDLPALRYAVQKGGITNLIITKFDILDGMEKVPLCVAYEQGIPVSSSNFFDAKPQYVNVPGWKSGKDKEQLASFIGLIEGMTCPVDYVSAGTDEKDIFEWRAP